MHRQDPPRSYFRRRVQPNCNYFWLIFFVTVAEFCSTTRCAEAFGAFFLGFFTSRLCESLFPMASILPQFEKDASMSPQTAPKIAPSLYLRHYPGNMPPSGSLAKCPISARCGICYTEHFT